MKEIKDCDNPSECPECGKKAKRIFNMLNSSGSLCIRFRGWGWSRDGYDGVSKEQWKQKNVFNKDGSLKSREGDKHDWPDQKVFDQKPRKDKSKDVKVGRRRIK